MRAACCTLCVREHDHRHGARVSLRKENKKKRRPPLRHCIIVLRFKMPLSAPLCPSLPVLYRIVSYRIVSTVSFLCSSRSRPHHHRARTKKGTLPQQRDFWRSQPHSLSRNLLRRVWEAHIATEHSNCDHGCLPPLPWDNRALHWVIDAFFIRLSSHNAQCPSSSGCSILTMWPIPSWQQPTRCTRS